MVTIFNPVNLVNPDLITIIKIKHWERMIKNGIILQTGRLA